MIDARELRVGNLVLDGDTPVHVTEILSKRINHNQAMGCPYEDLSPIELTPEILEKCGFEEQGGEYTHPDITDFDLMITCSENGLWCAYNYGNIQHNSPFPETTKGYCVNPICNPFKYVHQLQNLIYCLSGEELNYKP